VQVCACSRRRRVAACYAERSCTAIILSGAAERRSRRRQHVPHPLLTRGQATDASGNPVARQLYDAWGNVRYVTGTLPTDIGFTGQRADATGLMYYRARYYAQGIGRFISADTMVPGAGNPQAFNRYSYALNSPLNYIDPSGHMPTCDLEAGNSCAPVMDSLTEIYQAYHAGYDGLFAKDHQLADFFRMHPDYDMSENPGLLDGDYNESRTMHNSVEMERGNPTAWLSFGVGLWLGMLIGPGSGPAIENTAGNGKPSNAQKELLGDPDCAGCGYRLRSTWQQGVQDKLGTRMPDSWGDGIPNNNKTGWRWLDPSNPSGNGVRVDMGDPFSAYPSQQVDHVVVRYNGRIVGPDGSLLPPSARLVDYPEAHIPLSEYRTWSKWYAP
jgi:RHS repeat-associated protein